MKSETLDSRDRVLIIKNALRLMKGQQGTLLFVAVMRITSYGSTNSYRICQELGWNPDTTLGEWRKAN